MDESVLTSRDRIRILIEAQPGLHLRELPRRLGFSLRSVRYHLETMAEEDVVTPHRSGRFERWFAAGRFSAEDRSLISALRVAAQRAILTALLRNGSLRFVSLQRRTGLSPATLTRNLERLTAEGLVEFTIERQYVLRDPSATEMRLSSYRQRFPDLLADTAIEIFDGGP